MSIAISRLHIGTPAECYVCGSGVFVGKTDSIKECCQNIYTPYLNQRLTKYVNEDIIEVKVSSPNHIMVK